MNIADTYLKNTIKEILRQGEWDVNPRTKWSDGTPARSKFITQKVFEYNISKGEFPINTLRDTALKGAFHDIEAIYLKQTNLLEEMHFSIHNWWKDFSIGEYTRYWLSSKPKLYQNIHPSEEVHRNLNAEGIEVSRGHKHIGQTYGHTVKRYNLINKLLKGLEENPFGRRHKMNLWQEQEVIDDPRALEPCAGMTMWSVRQLSKDIGRADAIITRYIDLTLIQRSQDFLMTASINPAQYTMLGMMVCNHLTFNTGIKHEIGKMLHVVQNVHIYNRHLGSATEILGKESTGLQPKIKLTCVPKNFYNHTIEDFEFSGLEGIKKLENKLEIAI